MVKTSPSNALGVGSIPSYRELRSLMPRSQNNQNIKQKQYYDKFNKDFKNGPHQENLKKKNSLSPVFHTNSLSLIKMNVYR